MKTVWKGINETFRYVENEHSRISKESMQRKLSSMLLMLKASTPKDTGFASSRWTISGSFPRYQLGNDADYIKYLNEGSSKQAPAFFIERIALQFGKPFGKITTVTP
jgi:hypothetical protein